MNNNYEQCKACQEYYNNLQAGLCPKDFTIAAQRNEIAQLKSQNLRLASILEKIEDDPLNDYSYEN